MIKNLSKRTKYIILSIFIFILFVLIIWNTISHRLSLKADLSELNNNNIIIITIDGFNQSFINKNNTPNIYTNLENGIYFKNCFSPSIQDLPAYTSFFSGLYPGQHKIKDNLSGKLLQTLPLLESYKSKNYKTAAFISNIFLSSYFGLNKSFEYYHDEFELIRKQKINKMYLGTGAITYNTIKWIQHTVNNKFFLWVNYSALVSDKFLSGDKINNNFEDKYIKELQSIDNQIGKIISFLKKEKIFSDTILIITAPYSSKIADSTSLPQREHRVPLIINIPETKKINGIKLNNYIETIDIIPTLSDFLDIATPKNIEGKSLKKTITFKDHSDLTIYFENYYPYYHFASKPEHTIIFNSKYKYFKGNNTRLNKLNKKKENLINKNQKLEKRLKKIISKFTQEKNEILIEKNIDYDIALMFSEKGYLPPNNASKKLKFISRSTIQNFLLARVYFNNKNYENVLKLFNKKQPELNNYNEPLFLKALTYLKYNKTEKATKILKELVKKEPDNRIFVYKLADLYINSSKINECIEFLKKVRNKTQNCSNIESKLGDLYLELKQIKNAKDCYENIINKKKKAYPMYKLGIIEFNNGNLKKSENLIKKALNLNERIRNAYYYLGLINSKQKNYQQALLYFKKEIEMFPTDSKIYLKLVNIYDNLGHTTREIYYLKEYIKNKPDDFIGYIKLAEAYFKTRKNIQQAIALIHKGIELCNRTNKLPQAYYLLSDIYKYLGDKKRNKYYYKLATKIKIYGLKKTPIR